MRYGRAAWRDFPFARPPIEHGTWILQMGKRDASFAHSSRPSRIFAGSLKQPFFKSIAFSFDASVVVLSAERHRPN